jgi:hypothetical protein
MVVHLFRNTFIIFITLNIIENIIHFSIGRDSILNKEDYNIHLDLPSGVALIKFVGIMILFGVLQAGLTTYFD